MRFHLFVWLSLPLLTFASREQQIPMNTDVVPPIVPQPSLADLLTIEPSASIFYSYARELELSARFSDPSVRYTLFVPTNKAVMALAHKPHQSPVDENIKISEVEFDKQSKRNVERWVSSHIVPKSPIILESHHSTLLPNKSISFTSTVDDDGQPRWNHVTLDDSIHILGMKQGLNGVLYMIDGAILSD